jgi:hypothetical protein
VVVFSAFPPSVGSGDEKAAAPVKLGLGQAVGEGWPTKSAREEEEAHMRRGLPAPPPSLGCAGSPLRLLYTASRGAGKGGAEGA